MLGKVMEELQPAQPGFGNRQLGMMGLAIAMIELCPHAQALLLPDKCASIEGQGSKFLLGPLSPCSARSEPPVPLRIAFALAFPAIVRPLD